MAVFSTQSAVYTVCVIVYRNFFFGKEQITRISISSVIMYFIANMVDVYIYDALKKKMNNKHMWLRNNVATIICNTLENFFFMFGAFFGIYDNKTILMMAITTSLVEIVVGLCDTPFLYLSTKLTKKEIINE